MPPDIETAGRQRTVGGALGGFIGPAAQQRQQYRGDRGEFSGIRPTSDDLNRWAKSFDHGSERPLR